MFEAQTTNSLSPNNSQRAEWIDCLKFISILGVIIQHSYMILFSHKTSIVDATQFSVPLFVMLGGMTGFASQKRRIDSPYFQDAFRRLKQLLVPYLICVAAITSYECDKFDLLVFIKKAVFFTANSPHYYILFYAQLILAARILYCAIDICLNSKKAFLWHAASLASAALASAFFMRYTFILDVHGGGKYLLGGTFFFIYFAGMTFGAYYKKINLSKKSALILLIASFLIAPLYALFFHKKGLIIDNALRFFGSYNPSGPTFIIYAIIVLIFGMSLNQVIDDYNIKVLSKARTLVAKLGKHTLYIFLFHYFIYTFFHNSKIGPLVEENIWIKRIFYIAAEISIPIAIECFVNYVLSFFKSLIDSSRKRSFDCKKTATMFFIIIGISLSLFLVLCFIK